jgi:putative transposase
LSVAERRVLVEPDHPQLSLVRQCQLLGLSRSGLYYQPVGESAENVHLMHLIDAEYTRHPFFGYRKITHWLRQAGYPVNKKRVQRLMQTMGLAAIGPKPNLSKPSPAHPVYPYLLRGVKVERVNQVWSADITYIRLAQGWMYLVAILDWFSRYVLAWEVSITLDTDFCLIALERALQHGCPTIFNTDQGAQFTSNAFTSRLATAHIAISMDSRGRALDNIFVERLWRTVKYEEVYPNDYQSVQFGQQRLASYFLFYNTERPHQALGYRTPAEVFFGSYNQTTLS